MAYYNNGGQYAPIYDNKIPENTATTAYHNNGGQYAPIYDNNYLSPQPPMNSRFSEQGYDSYSPYENAMKHLEEKDAKIKFRIRLLRFVSRVLAVLLSIAVVVPCTMTFIKYLETANTTHSGFGTEQPIWPEHRNLIYTYVYFGVSIVSMLLNAIIVVSYCHGVRRANSAATISTVWSTIIILAHISIWFAGVAIYRYGKHKVNDQWEDLWGWTCSKAAQDIQPFVKEINFEKYCNVQNAAYIAGLVQVGASVLTFIIFILMAMRLRTKKRLQNYQLDDAKEPLRGS